MLGGLTVKHWCSEDGRFLFLPLPEPFLIIPANQGKNAQITYPFSSTFCMKSSCGTSLYMTL